MELWNLKSVQVEPESWQVLVVSRTQQDLVDDSEVGLKLLEIKAVSAAECTLRVGPVS